MKTLTILKIVFLIFSIITLCVGLYSHFASKWVSTKAYRECEKDQKDQEEEEEEDFEEEARKCPPIGMERFFVGMVIISFLYAFVTLIISCYRDCDCNVADAFLHACFGILLLTAAALFIISAVQIDDWYYRDFDNHDYEETLKRTVRSATVKKIELDDRPKFLKWPKISSGILAIIQTLLHLVVGMMAFSENDNSELLTSTLINNSF